jgi:glycine/D-amino acid oxidase-like deaminating enzyme/bacterioferritin-associated ferredoxin
MRELEEGGTLVCRCEEVLEAEVLEAIASGAASVPWVKRLTRAGMGVCQGKVCGGTVQRLLAKHSGVHPMLLFPDSPRPPLRPVTVETLARFPEIDAPCPAPPAPPQSQAPRDGVTWSQREVDFLVIGAGSTGCSVAYHLARRGKSVLVVDQAEVAQEGSGRNLGGIRQLGRHPSEVPIARESLRMWAQIQDRHDIEMRHMGYLWVALSEMEMSLQEKAHRLQVDMGVRSELLSGALLRRTFPALSERSLQGLHCPDDAQANPIKATRALAAMAVEAGAEIREHTPVYGFLASGGEIQGAETNRGRVTAKKVILAAGPWAKPMAQWVGLDLPLTAVPNQIMVTEPMGYMVRPLVLTGLAVCLQGARGNAYIGNVDPPGVSGFGKETVLKEMFRSAKNILEVLPGLAKVRVIRSWAGVLDLTPDDIPIIGEPEEAPGLFLATGFAGHGFAISPMIGQLIAQALMGERPSLPMDDFDPGRFRSGAARPIQHFTHQHRN